MPGLGELRCHQVRCNKYKMAGTRRATTLRRQRTLLVHDDHDVAFGVAEEGHRQLVVARRVDDLRLALEDHAPRHQFVVADMYVRHVEVQGGVAYLALLFDPGDHQPGISNVKKGQSRRKPTNESQAQLLPIELHRSIEVLHTQPNLPQRAYPTTKLCHGNIPSDFVHPDGGTNHHCQSTNSL